jgi:hypothetical protein
MFLGTSLLAIAVSIQAQKKSNLSYFLATEKQELLLKDQDVEGTEIAITEDGRSVKLKITHVELDPQDPQRETYLYSILYRNPVSGHWQDYCQRDRNHVSKAIPLSGYWDQSGNHIEDEHITFACTSGVLAKCVRLGYKPWKTVKGQPLRSYHQACTRMVRADYCGNGRSHTKDGTLIDIYDRMGIQTRTPASGMAFEAAWSPNGAVFINRTRWPESLAQLRKECPERLKRSESSSIDPKIVQIQTDEVLLFNDSYHRLEQVGLSR